jgi:N-acetylglucosamine malate deacetylase 1
MTNGRMTNVGVLLAAPPEYFPPMPNIDVLAIAAHRDDVELTCGGTLIKAARQGYATGVVDLTEGETGTRGTAESRALEAEKAASVLGLTVRENLRLPDAGIVNTPETRAIVALAVRRLKPRIIIAPAQQGRHPDHRVTAELVRDACFISGLVKIEPSLLPHRPHKLLNCMSFREDWIKPTFVVDVSEEFDQKIAAIACYQSQFEGATRAGEVQPNGESLLDIVRHHAAHYGSYIRTRYGEPYFTMETMRVDDVMALGVSSY